TPRCDCASNLAQPADTAEPLHWTRSWLELRPDNETGDDGWQPLYGAPSPPRCAVAPPVQDSWPLAVAGSRLFAVEHRVVPGCGPQPERLARLWITDLALPAWDADASEALLTALFHELPGSVVDDARAQAATALGVDHPHDLELLALHPRADALVLLFGTPRPREAGGAGGWDDLTGEFILSLPLPASSSLTAPSSVDPNTWGDPWTPIGWSTQP
ncbi:MAG: hypothetical protein KC457_23825, partial [Myxococcales bacterium]|nr:hypothetical protein [Myxococcales bacterium]